MRKMSVVCIVALCAVLSPVFAAWQPGLVQAATIYVSSGGSHTAPYNSWETAATNLQVAVEYAREQQGDSTDVPVINVAEGTTYLYDAVICDAPVIIKGAGRDKTILNGAPLNMISRGIAINCDNVLLQDLTVMGCTNQYLTKPGGVGIYMNGNSRIENVRITKNVNWYDGQNHPSDGAVTGGGIYLTAGVVTNCIINENKIVGNWHGPRGCGVYMTGGEVVDCEIRDNWRGQTYTTGRSQGRGFGVHLTGGTLRRCSISGNNNGEQEGSSYGFGVNVEGKDAVVDGCSIVSNGLQGVYMTAGTIMNSLIFGHNMSSTTRSAGIEMTDGYLYNCTITDNIGKGSYAGLKMTKGTAVNNIIYGNTDPAGARSDAYVSTGTFNTNIVSSTFEITTETAEGNLVINPGFVDPDNGNYAIDFSSSAFDVGATIDTVKTDISGTSRPQGSSYDIGCYEYMPSDGEMLVAFMVHSPDYPYGAEIILTSRILGGTAPYSYKWVANNVELTSETSSSADLSSVLRMGQNRITLTVTDKNDVQNKAETTINIKPTTVYVARDGSDENNFPYHDETKPAKSVKAAMEALWIEEGASATVNIGKGEFMLDAGVVCNTPITIKGAGRDDTILNGAPLYNAARGITVNAAGTILEDFTITGCTNDIINTDGGIGIYMTADGIIRNVRITKNVNWHSSGDNPSTVNGGGLYMTAGVVTNCLIDHNDIIVSWHGPKGCGIYMTGGEVIDCEILDNWRGADLKNGRNQGAGLGVYMTGGSLKNCYIAGNNNTTRGSTSLIHGESYGLGVNINGSSATVENCVIVSNAVQGVYMSAGKLVNSLIVGHKMTDGKRPAGVRQAGGSIYNCTIADNINTASTLTNDLMQTGGTLLNTIAMTAVVLEDTSREINLLGENGVAIDPKFVNAAKGNYRLRRSSPAVNAGDNGVWDGIEGATDLDGNPRISNNKIKQVDIGCYEMPASKATIIMIR